ncbi:putative transcriptional regulator with C-terminal CBS domains [Opitutaceae bacterium TAV1]|nr:putative transcriptional regulator with C-terminal CBS domains [Opitutaceae bacterium TAV1]
MNFPVTTPAQLRSMLRALRQACSLSQEQVGRLLGVNQKRIARIETAPEVTSFGQIARLVSALGGRLVIEDARPSPQSADKPDGRIRKTAAGRPGTSRNDRANW